MDNEKVLQWMQTEDGKKFMQPILDRNFTKGLETWKQNTIPKLIEDHDKSKIDPHERKVSELQLTLEKKQKIKALKLKSAEVGLDAFVSADEMIEVLSTLDEDQANQTIEILHKHFYDIYKTLLTEECGERIKSMCNPPRNDGQINQDNGLGMSKEQLLKMDYKERARIYTESPERYRQIMSS